MPIFVDSRIDYLVVIEIHQEFAHIQPPNCGFPIFPHTHVCMPFCVVFVFLHGILTRDCPRELIGQGQTNNTVGRELDKGGKESRIQDHGSFGANGSDGTIGQIAIERCSVGGNGLILET